MNKKVKVTRREMREHLEQFNLAAELAKVINHFFPDLTGLLKNTKDPREQGCVTYPNIILLMTRILSSIFYISSMRKTSQKFNSDTVIQNIWQLSREDMTAGELPYWEIINKYLERLEPQELQDVIHKPVRKLLRSRAFEDAGIRGKYWQVIIDGTQVYSSREKLDEKSLYRVHGRYAPILKAEYVVPSILLTFHEEVFTCVQAVCIQADGKVWELLFQAVHQAAACLPLTVLLPGFFPIRILHKLRHDAYNDVRVQDSLRFQDIIIIFRIFCFCPPVIADEFGRIRKIEGNRQEQTTDGGICWHDFVTGIDYNGYGINIVEYGGERQAETKSGPGKGKLKEVMSKFVYITDLPVSKKNVAVLVEAGRRRWKIENQGFNTQKRHGYCLEHLFSKNCQAIKNHYFLMQIGHMISQVMEAWVKLWKKAGLDLREKHERILESFRSIRLCEYEAETGKKFQMRFQ